MRHDGGRNEQRRPATAPAQGVPAGDYRDLAADFGVATPVVAPVNFDQPITGMHADPLQELAARVARNQHVTEGVAGTATTIETRVQAVEIDIKSQGLKLDAQGAAIAGQGVKQDAQGLKLDAHGAQLVAIQSTLNAQDKYLAPLAQMAPALAQMAASGQSLVNTVHAANVQIGAAEKVDELDKGKQRRERWTAGVKTVLAYLGVASGPVLAYLGLRSC